MDPFIEGLLAGSLSFGFMSVLSRLFQWIPVPREKPEKKAHFKTPSDALGQAQAQLITVADLSPHLTWCSSLEGRFLWCNRGFREFTGLSLVETNERGWKFLTPAVDKTRVYSKIHAHLLREAPWEEQLLLRRYDGEFRWHLACAAPIKDEKGKLVNWLVTATGIPDSIEASQRLRLAVEVAGRGVFSIDYDTNTIIPDYTAARIFNLIPNVAVPRQVVHHQFHPDDREVILRHIEESLKPDGDGRFALEHRIIQSDGSVRWLNVGKYVRFSFDRPKSGVLAAVDITDRKHAEFALARSEAEYRSIFEMAQMANAEARFDTGKIVRANRKFCELFGYTREELFQKSFVDLTHPEDSENCSIQVDRCRRMLIESFELEKRYLRKDGTVIWANSIATLLKDDAGKPFSLLANIQDITARKQIEDRFQESESRFRAFMDNTPAFAYIKDENGRFVYVNHRGAELKNCSPNEWIGKTVVDLFPGSDATEFSEHDHLVLQSDRPVQFVETLGTDDQRLYFLSIKFPLKTIQDKVFLAGLSVDVTAQHRAEQELIEADKRKNQFLATLAHELRNPLAPIRNAVQILRMKASLDPEMNQIKDMLGRQVGQMSRLLDDLIDVSRITRNKLELHKDRVKLSKVIESAIETSRPLIDSVNHNLTLNLPSTEIYLDADFVRLSQVFSNLLNNVARFTPDGGQIRISAEIQGDQVVTSVLDNGVGISAEMLQKNFEIFWQGQSNPGSLGTGLGIGLSIVRGMVELHGGSVQVQSDGPGKGCLFKVFLPIMTTGLTVLDQNSAIEPNGRTLRSRKILVVDDNRDSADSMGLQLRLKGHEIRIAYDGEEALEIADHMHPEFVMLDIGLPRISGHDVARRIRQQPWGSEVVLIAMTGWGQPEDRDRSREAGIDHHLTKPVDPEVLDAILKETNATEKQAGVDDFRSHERKNTGNDSD